MNHDEESISSYEGPFEGTEAGELKGLKDSRNDWVGLLFLCWS
jgi:hypothetical protein